jgi:hypothetical protein
MMFKNEFVPVVPGSRPLEIPQGGQLKLYKVELSSLLS